MGGGGHNGPPRARCIRLPQAPTVHILIIKTPGLKQIKEEAGVRPQSREDWTQTKFGKNACHWSTKHTQKFSSDKRGHGGSEGDHLPLQDWLRTAADKVWSATAGASPIFGFGDATVLRLGEVGLTFVHLPLVGLALLAPPHGSAPASRAHTSLGHRPSLVP